MTLTKAINAVAVGVVVLAVALLLVYGPIAFVIRLLVEQVR